MAKISIDIIQMINSPDPTLRKIIETNISEIKSIRSTVQNNVHSYVNITIINEQMPIDADTISIVMTTHDRIRQTLFTLDTINTSVYKNIQIIIVDDSVDKFIDTYLLKKYPWRIDYVQIKNPKPWTNPCVNYNIGFSQVKGSYIIIQNAEVCHIGDVISHCKKHCTENNYLVYDVINMGTYSRNNKLYSYFKNGKFNIPGLYTWFSNTKLKWCQIHTKPRNYHYLVGICANDLFKLGGFDYDLAMGRWYDDDEFLYRIVNLLKLNIINYDHQILNLCGAHQHHDKVLLDSSQDEYQKSIALNSYIFSKKKAYFYTTAQWLDLSGSDDTDLDESGVIDKLLGSSINSISSISSISEEIDCSD